MGEFEAGCHQSEDWICQLQYAKRRLPIGSFRTRILTFRIVIISGSELHFDTLVSPILTSNCAIQPSRA